MESHLSAGRHGPSATLEAELVFLHVQGREEVEVLDPQKAMEDAGGVLGLTCARTRTRLFSLASMVMLGHLPGNCSELDPEWELGKAHSSIWMADSSFPLHCKYLPLSSSPGQSLPWPALARSERGACVYGSVLDHTSGLVIKSGIIGGGSIRVCCN